MSDLASWFVVLARTPAGAGKSGHRVMGVFGAALQDKANACEESIRAEFPFQALVVVKLSVATRPRVGEVLFFSHGGRRVRTQGASR